jgi:hypothetical protein
MPVSNLRPQGPTLRIVVNTATPVCRSTSPACAKPLRRRQDARAQGLHYGLFVVGNVVVGLYARE